MGDRSDQIRAMREAAFNEAAKRPVKQSPRQPKVISLTKKGRPPKTDYRTPDGKFDRRAYMRDKMREYRASDKTKALPSL